MHSYPCLVHDESTFRSGEVSPKRWLFNNNAPFFSKGRGRSVMISDYLVMHPSGPFFTLNDKEYQQALTLYPELADDVGDVTYVEKTATGSINVGYDSYFDNSTILAQFERLFKLLRFKSEFKNHNIEVIVDNATTHTAKPYSLSDFGKSIGTRCTTDTIEYMDSQGQLQVIDCFFKRGPNNGLSKGLLEISTELNVKLPPKVKLEQLREILANHPAFKVVSLIKYVTCLLFMLLYRHLGKTKIGRMKIGRTKISRRKLVDTKIGRYENWLMRILVEI